MFKVNNKRHWRRSGFFIVNFEHISHLLVFLLLTLNMQLSAGSNEGKFCFKFRWRTTSLQKV